MAKNDKSTTPGSGPKHSQIYAQLRQSLIGQQYSSGDKLPSDNELVEQYGVSRPTIARALSQLEREGLVERRAGSGTFVSPQGRDGGFVFGLLIPGLGDTEIFEPICRGISIARGGGNHELLWGPTFSPTAAEELQAEQLCEYYIRRHVSGVFFAPMELVGEKDEINQRITAALDEAKIPVVLLDRDLCSYPKRSRYDLVTIDNRRAGFVITSHVLECGARRLVFLARPQSAPTVAMRAFGFKDAIHIDESLGAKGWIEYGDPSDIVFVAELVSRLQPDAFVCANDYSAARLMTSLSSLGIQVPAAVKVTGMDDIRYASVLQTPLTTIHQPCLELGAAALAAMLDRISNPNMHVRDCLVDFKLVVRQSTDPQYAERTSALEQADNVDNRPPELQPT
jgi:GntR family transcriptional regulator of arabinose operon